MLSLVALIILVALLEGIIRYHEVRQLVQTQVSTIPQTDYTPPKLVNWFAWSIAGLAISVLIAGSIWGMPAIGRLVLLAVYLLCRLALMSQTLAAARLSVPLRLRQAMAHPKICNAKIAFHFSGVDYPDAVHFYMWEQELKDIDENLVLLLRENKHLAHERDRASTPALFLPNANTITQYSYSCKDTLKAVFYANNGMKNAAFVKALSHAKHIQLLHGDSDKPPSFSPATKLFSLVFVAGKMGIDRYKRNGVQIPHEKFRVVGRPQLSVISDETRVTTEASRRVVYMPTWRGFFADTQFSSLGHASQIIETILAADHPTTLHFKPHPLSYKDPHWPQLERDIRTALGKKRPNGNTGVFREDATSPFDLYNEADLMVTDISSVMIDFLYSGKPSLVVLPPDFNAAEDTERFPSLEASYQVASSLENLSAQFEKAIGDDPLKIKREKVRLYAFGDYGRPPGEAFREACLALLDDSCDTSVSLSKKG